MLRLLAASLVRAFVLTAHLRNDRRKGSHPQKSHGSWSPNNSFTSKRTALRAKRSGGGRRSVARATEAPKRKPSPFAGDPFADDDPFAEDYGANEPESKEERQRQRYEEKLVRQQEKAERSRLRNIVLDAGGLQTRDDLREEYRGIPNTLKRRDGLAGDEMADYLKTYYAEFGIEDERDLIDFLAA